MDEEIRIDNKKEIAARLEVLCRKNKGVLKPDNVVKDARNQSSPLHKCFEWDDAVAAHERRLDVARHIIASVRVEYRTESRVIEAPKYVRDPTKPRNEQGYDEVAKLKTDRDLAYESIQYELKRAVAMLERVCDLADAFGIGDEANELLKRIDVLRGRLTEAA